MRTPGERRVRVEGRRCLRGMLLVLVIAGIEGMGLIRRGVDRETRLLGRGLGIVGRWSPRHDGRVCRPRGGEILLATAGNESR